MIKKLFTFTFGALLAVSLMTLGVGASASALSPSRAKTDGLTLSQLSHQQFSATGFATSFTSTITEPPQIGQYFILDETLRTNQNVTIGTDHIKCVVTHFTQTMPRVLTFACLATFTLTNGTLTATATFSSNQVNYDAQIVRGTGAYATVLPLFSVIHVTDHGPFLPTGYSFDLTLL